LNLYYNHPISFGLWWIGLEILDYESIYADCRTAKGIWINSNSLKCEIESAISVLYVYVCFKNIFMSFPGLRSVHDSSPSSHTSSVHATHEMGRGRNSA